MALCICHFMFSKGGHWGRFWEMGLLNNCIEFCLISANFPWWEQYDFSQSFLKSYLSLCCYSASSSLTFPGSEGSWSSLCPLCCISEGLGKLRTGQAQISTHSHPPTLLLPSWILFDEKNFEGDQHILSEGEFPTLTAMGCLASTVLGSLRKVPLVSVPV